MGRLDDHPLIFSTEDVDQEVRTHNDLFLMTLLVDKLKHS